MSRLPANTFEKRPLVESDLIGDAATVLSPLCATEPVQMVGVQRYPYGADIVTNNTINHGHLPAASQEFLAESTVWLGVVKEGAAAITTTYGIDNGHRYDNPPVLSGASGLNRLAVADCLKYRTTIRRVLTRGDVFLAWEAAQSIANNVLGLAGPDTNLYVYDIHAGSGPVLLAWAWGYVSEEPTDSSKRKKKQLLASRANLPDLGPAHQLLRFNSQLVLDALIDPALREALHTEILWIPLQVGAGSGWDVRVLAYAWHQSRGYRLNLVRQEQVAEALAGASASKLFRPLIRVGYLTQTLCYLDDALARQVPLYRFVEAGDKSDPFFAIAESVRPWLKSRQGRKDPPERFLLVPRVDDLGGRVSIRLPIAAGAVVHAQEHDWPKWLKAFTDLGKRLASTQPGQWESAAGPALERLLPNLVRAIKNDGWVLEGRNSGGRSAMANRNSAFLHACVVLRPGNRQVH